MNPRGTRETKNRKALDETIEQITVCTFGNNELTNIKRAKKCYDKASLDADWQAVVVDVRQRQKLVG